jgi:hypothetical protein
MWVVCTFGRRPVTKKGTADRKTVARPRRLLGNGPGDLSGKLLSSEAVW